VACSWIKWQLSTAHCFTLWALILSGELAGQSVARPDRLMALLVPVLPLPGRTGDPTPLRHLVIEVRLDRPPLTALRRHRRASPSCDGDTLST